MNTIDTGTSNAANRVTAEIASPAKSSLNDSAAFVSVQKPAAEQKTAATANPETRSALNDLAALDKNDQYVQTRPLTSGAVYSITDIKKGARKQGGMMSNAMSTMDLTKRKNLIADILLAMGIKNLKIFRTPDTSEKQGFERTL